MKKKIPWHYHDRARGIYYDGLKEIDLEPIIKLKEQYDAGNKNILSELVDKVIEAQEEKNYEQYLIYAANNGNKTAKLALDRLKKSNKKGSVTSSYAYDKFVVFFILSIIVLTIGFVAIFYYFTFLLALAFFLVGIVICFFIIYIIMKLEIRRYNDDDKEPTSDIAKYGIDLEKATVKELVEHFHMTYSSEERKEFVNLHRHQYVLNEQKDIFLKRKKEVIEYLKERQNYVDGYYVKLDEISGLEKYFYKYDRWAEWNRVVFEGKLDTKRADEEAIKLGLPNNKEMRRLYPKAFALMKALGIALNYPYNDIGNITLKNIINGKDSAAAINETEQYINGKMSIVDIDKFSIDMKKLVRAYLNRALDTDVSY